MRVDYIDVDKRWGVVIVWDFDMGEDYHELKSTMDAFGMDVGDIDDALDVLSYPNSGMTISRHDIRMSIIYIGDATSIGEWWSTCIHELKHVHDAILYHYGVGLDGEPSAYTIGHLARGAMEEMLKSFL